MKSFFMDNRKITISGRFLICFIFLAACSRSESYPDHYASKDLAGEPPISQIDIDALECMKPKYDAIDVNDQRSLAKIAKICGITHKRNYYLASKLMIAVSLALGQNVNYPPNTIKEMRVSGEELELVKRNWDKIARPGSPKPAN